MSGLSPVRGERHARYLRLVFDKTGGHCHFCGDRLVFKNRGRSAKPRGRWEVDHVNQRGKGGSHSADNCLPACTKCNRLRSAHTGPNIQELLVMGGIAVKQMRDKTKLGKELRSLKKSRERKNEERRISNQTRQAAKRLAKTPRKRSSRKP
jgi:molybdenum cofactor biosynthesis enzyme MoaA